MRGRDAPGVCRWLLGTCAADPQLGCAGSGGISPEWRLGPAQLQHANLHIVECDARIHRAYPFAGQLQTVCGGGGTDLRPPFAPELLQQHGSAGVVYFTDGMGPWPENAPPQPVLWILLGDHRFGCPFGVQVRMG